MTIYATNGAKLFIGAVLAAKSTDFVEADFSTETWVEIGETEADEGGMVTDSDWFTDEMWTA